MTFYCHIICCRGFVSIIYTSKTKN